MKSLPFFSGITIAAAFVAGCQSHPPQPIVTLAQPAPFLSPEQRGHVWLPDEVAPYAVGRYVDPRDPNVLHEAHTLYRREQASRPNLAPPAALVLPPSAGPAATNTTAFLRDALTAELNQQRAVSLSLVEQAKGLARSVSLLNQQSEEFRNALQEAAQVRAQWQAVSNRLWMLERQLQSVSAGSPVPSTTNSSAPRP